MQRGNCSSRQLRAAYLRAPLHPSTRPPNCSPPPVHRHSKYYTTEREDETPGPDKTNTTWQLQLTRDAYLNIATRRHGHARRPTDSPQCGVKGESSAQHTCFKSRTQRRPPINLCTAGRASCSDQEGDGSPGHIYPPFIFIGAPTMNLDQTSAPRPKISRLSVKHGPLTNNVIYLTGRAWKAIDIWVLTSS